MKKDDKEKFHDLLHKAISSPSASRKAAKKRRDGYTDKQTRPRSAGDVAKKRSGKSREQRVRQGVRYETTHGNF